MAITFFQSIAFATAIVALGILLYLKFLKNRLKKHVLRNDKIEKYFQEKE